MGEAALRWKVGVEGRLEVVWLDQLANFNEDKRVRLFWEMSSEQRYTLKYVNLKIIVYHVYSTVKFFVDKSRRSLPIILPWLAVHLYYSCKLKRNFMLVSDDVLCMH